MKLEEREELGLGGLKQGFLEKEAIRKDYFKNLINNQRLSFAKVLDTYSEEQLPPSLFSKKNNKGEMREEESKKQEIISLDLKNINKEGLAKEYLSDLKSYEYITEQKGFERYYKNLHHQSLSNDINLSVSRIIMDNGRDTDMLSFAFVDNSENIDGLEIRYKKKGNIWELDHRIIDEKFQGQGFGKEIINFSEECIREISEKEETSPTFTAEVGQINALYWFLKNGYVPQTSLDEEKTRKVLEGSDELEIIDANTNSRKGWEDFDVEDLPQQYIREKNSSLSLKDFWDDYMNKGFRIKLIKK